MSVSLQSRVMVFGAGEAGRRVMRALPADRVVCFIDNDSAKHGTRVDGLEVRSPAEIDRYPDARVIIASLYEDDIVVQLLRAGVSADRIHLPELPVQQVPVRDPFPWGFLTILVCVLGLGASAVAWLFGA